MTTRTLVNCTYPDGETSEYTLGYPHGGCVELLDGLSGHAHISLARAGAAVSRYAARKQERAMQDVR